MSKTIAFLLTGLVVAMAGCSAIDGEVDATDSSEARGSGPNHCRQLFDSARTTLTMPSASTFMSRCSALPSTLVQCLVHDFAMTNEATCVREKTRAPQPALSGLYTR